MGVQRPINRKWLHRTKTGVGIRYHGNYCGPNWSDGKFQGSVAYGRTKPIDQFDSTCRTHDTTYRLGGDLNKADEIFYKQNIGRGVKRSAAALAVYAQKKMRGDVQTSTEVGFPVVTSFPQKDMASPGRGRSVSMRSRSRSGRSPRTPSPRGNPSPPRSTVKRSPAFLKRVRWAGGKYLIRKSKRSSGASSSRSSGFIRRGTSKRTPIDYYSQNGISVCRESSGVISTTAAEKAQSVMVGHSTFTKLQLKQDVACAWTKLVANYMDRQFGDFTEFIGIFGSETFSLIIEYRAHPGAGLSSTTSNYSTGNTWQDMADQLNAVLALADGQTGLQFTSMKLDRGSATDQPTRVFYIDLTKMKIKVYNKSSLKFQNRTINTSGNNEDDDVDNVPLYGKMYTGSGNYIMTNENGIVHGTASPSSGSDLYSPVVTVKFTAGPLQEPQSITSLQKVSQLAKVHLDPGQIKTNTLVYQKVFKLNFLVQALARTGSDITAGTSNMINFGKFAFIHLEKMLQAVATTDVNAMNVAYECDHKTGVKVSCPKIRQTNMRVLVQNR